VNSAHAPGIGVAATAGAVDADRLRKPVLALVPWKWLGIGGLAWAALTVLVVTAFLVHLRIVGQPVEVWEVMSRIIVQNLFGALCTPIAVLAAHSFPISVHQLRNVLLHGIGFALFHGTWSAANATYRFSFAPQVWTDQFLPYYGGLFTAGLPTGITLYILIVTIYLLVRHYEVARARELEASQLETRLAQAELGSLRAQLQPHFLFNALHGISALMQKDVYAARHMISLLSDLLRSSLEFSSEQRVPLREEIDFLDRYLELQKMRFGDRLAVEYRIEPETLTARVPRLLLQPLVENSLRHGFSRKTAGGRVVVSAACRAGHLHLAVTDDGTGLPEGATRPPRLGIGIGNTAARLQQLYGGAQTLWFEQPPAGGLAVHITIPYESNGQRSGS
jgi:two-component system, LytTR family, sensor kinase